MIFTKNMPISGQYTEIKVESQIYIFIILEYYIHNLQIFNDL